MDRLIYTAVSGASRDLMQQQIHANNLSNANTEGFRADLERAGSSSVVGSGYDSRYLVSDQQTSVDMTPGAIRETGNPLDVAVKGEGLLAVRQGGQEVYTRYGAIKVDDQGRATIRDLPVMGQTGPVVLPPFSHVAIGDDGTITIIPEDGNVKAPMDVDRLKLVNIKPDRLRKNAEGYLVATGRVQVDDSVQVVSGHLETSNVSAINEMVATVSLNRQFEAQIKMMKAAEELVQAGNRLIRGG